MLYLLCTCPNDDTDIFKLSFCEAVTPAVRLASKYSYDLGLRYVAFATVRLRTQFHLGLPSL